MLCSLLALYNMRNWRDMALNEKAHFESITTCFSAHTYCIKIRYSGSLWIKALGSTYYSRRQDPQTQTGHENLTPLILKEKSETIVNRLILYPIEDLEWMRIGLLILFVGEGDRRHSKVSESPWIEGKYICRNRSRPSLLCSMTSSENLFVKTLPGRGGMETREDSLSRISRKCSKSL